MQVCKDCTWHSLCGVVCFCVIQTDDSSLQQYTIICSALIFGIYPFYQVFCQIARFYSNSSDQCLLMIPAGFPKKARFFPKAFQKVAWVHGLQFFGGNPWMISGIFAMWFFVRVPAWVGSKNVGHLYFHVLLNIFKLPFGEVRNWKCLEPTTKKNQHPPEFNTKAFFQLIFRWTMFKASEKLHGVKRWNHEFLGQLWESMVDSWSTCRNLEDP